MTSNCHWMEKMSAAAKLRIVLSKKETHNGGERYEKVGVIALRKSVGLQWTRQVSWSPVYDLPSTIFPLLILFYHEKRCLTFFDFFWPFCLHYSINLHTTISPYLPAFKTMGYPASPWQAPFTQFSYPFNSAPLHFVGTQVLMLWRILSFLQMQCWSVPFINIAQSY